MFDLSLEMLRVVEEAAIASARTMGMGDAKAADRAAVESMRRSMDTVPMDGTIVIGEGERDEAPMLYIGEKVGRAERRGDAVAVDIAVDPLEGTNSVRHRRRRCHHRTGSLRTRRIAARAGLLHGKDRRGPGGQGRGGSGRAGEAESEGHCAALAARRGRPGGGGARPSAAREADRRYSRSRSAHPPDLRWRPFGRHRRGRRGDGRTCRDGIGRRARRCVDGGRAYAA